MPGDPLLVGVAEEPEVRVEQAAQPLGIAQRQAAAGGPDVVRAEPPPGVGELALEREIASAERASHLLELGRTLAEAHPAAQALEAVREAAHAQAGSLEVERAAHERRRARARDRQREPRVALPAEAPGERRQHAQVGAPARFDRERALAERVDRAAHPQVGALARQAERAEVEPPARELQGHALASPHREVGRQQLELRQHGLRRRAPRAARAAP